MSTQAALPAQHTVLNAMYGSPAAYNAIANIGDWQPAPFSARTVEVSSHSTNQWSQFVPTLLDGGKISMPLYFIPSDAGHQQLITFFTSRGSSLTQPGVPIQFRVDFPDAAETTYKYKGFITGFKLEAPVAGVEKATVEIQLTDAPDLAATRDNLPLT